MGEFDLLIAGGHADPNVAVLIRAAEQARLRVCKLLHASAEEPALAWDPTSDELKVDGAPVKVEGAFLRFDVFGPVASSEIGVHDRAMGWYASAASWAQVAHRVRHFNRDMVPDVGHKGAALHRAHGLGLAVPQTRLTNAWSAMIDMDGPHRLIAKPAGGGSYTTQLDSDVINWVGDTAPAPAIVQERLVYPEYRVYFPGTVPFVFETRSSELDFRLDRAPDTRWVSGDKVEPWVLDKLRAFAKACALDFCAFDLKTRPGTGEVCFLEVNSNPMFAAFDAIASGALTRAMLAWLCPTQGSEQRPHRW